GKGLPLDGVSNLWIPFFILSVHQLKPGGAFAVVLPSEFFCTKSAGVVRSELVRSFKSVRVEFFPRNSFPDILQDVLVVSGVRAAAVRRKRPVEFREHCQGTTRCWRHVASDAGESWTRYLLNDPQLGAYEAAKRLPSVYPLGEVATIEVSIVTGANAFFTVTSQTLDEYELHDWARPLLARTAESCGIVFTKKDHARAEQMGKRSWLLDFSEDRPDPLSHRRAHAYLKIGEEKDLHKRYKCRIRVPWYRVPHIRRRPLMLAKRAHQHHRLILNQAAVFTTDTIYRGRMKRGYGKDAKDLVAGFHNSLTLLSAEVEGRSYGGGVLELVPSEIGALSVPLADAGRLLPELDAVSRDAGGQIDAHDRLLDATDQRLTDLVCGYGDVVGDLKAARTTLRMRRFAGSNGGR
ncbi:MAG: SAM-dependent methyltransferase, partial [Candidatus Brocadiae bacterium]|nr:SAM-dependent methyltransferase [Candidatus Brocadiia bacterium]